MPRILVADDNPLSLRYLVAALARPGMECSEATDGDAAVELASARRHDLLLERQRRQERYGNGLDPDFLPETAGIRADPTWRVAGAGPGLEDRRVEITVS